MRCTIFHACEEKMSKTLWNTLFVTLAIPGIVFKLSSSAIANPTSTEVNPQNQAAIETSFATNMHQSAVNLSETQIKPQPKETNADIPTLSLQPSDQLLTPPQPPYTLKANDLQLYAASGLSHSSPSGFAPNLQEEPVISQEPAPSEKNPPNKWQYNLFNPTPRKLWREFSTDRPDKTETPFTVDAGNFTMEADLFVYTRDANNRNDVETETFQVFIPNFKVGLLNNVDLQIIPEFYNIARTKPRGLPAEEISGFGDVTARVKFNFWGNDDGETAFAIIPFVKFPTNQNNLGNNSIEGGIIFPFAVSLSDKWDVGIQTEFDFNKNDSDSGYNIGFINSASFGYEISEKWGTYFELFTEQRTEYGSSFVATFDTGIKYLLTENVQLDAGVNIGLTEAADDFQPFIGMSVRF